MENRELKKEIIHVLKYFHYFQYLPSYDEIRGFLKTKALPGKLKAILQNMEKKGVIKTQINQTRKFVYPESDRRGNSITEVRYTLGEYSIKNKNSIIFQDKQALKIKNSLEKIKKIEGYIKLLSFFPQIQLVGLSGTVSMLNAEKKDDIDLFVITDKNRLWTGRIICLLAATLLGLRRKRGEVFAQNKVCLNLFFDKSGLTVPKSKQTAYVAHEVLQMKPLINKNFTYEQFIDKNNWIYKIFPNAKYVFGIQYPVSRIKIQNTEYSILNTLLNWIEFFLKKFELYFINRHRTTEIISSHQLWFFPDDFEKKLSSLLKIK